MAKTKKRRKPIITSKNTDKHMLYQMAVQSPEGEVAYFSRLYKRMRGRYAQSFREDFCGTAFLSCEWVKDRKGNTAVGVDLHGPTLDWGRKNNLSHLTDEQRSNLALLRKNVLNVTSPKVDILCALNFSYFIFKKRDELRQYFKIARKSIKKDGIFILDAFGGSDCFEEQEESRRCDGFTYNWEHANFNPVTMEILCHIHFEFKNGSKMRKAFTYDWRLWSLMEIQELLYEAGFSQAEVHWECTDHETGEGNGNFRKTVKGEAIESWVAYIIALP